MDAIADATGTLVETRGSDAFGKPRSGTWADLSPARIQSMAITGHGFTGHEHLNSVELIHMNGRVYDYALGKFLSVDPFIQFPLNSQSLNPYSYILNNPLAGTDPTGYTACPADPSRVCTVAKKTLEVTPTGTHIKGGMTTEGNAGYAGGTAGAGYTIQMGPGNGASPGATPSSSTGSRQAQAAGSENSVSTLDITSAGGNSGDIPDKVLRECRSYSLPASCGGSTNDQAIAHSAADHVATGSRLNPDFVNPAIAAETTSDGKTTNTALKVDGDVAQATIRGALSNWNGDGLKISPVNQTGDDSLHILARSTAQFAGDMCLSVCTAGYNIGGRTDLSKSTIYLNSDHPGWLQETSLTHEMGHFFFGNGHPQTPGDFLYGGIMDYHSQRVNDADREHFMQNYGKNPGGGP